MKPASPHHPGRRAYHFVLLLALALVVLPFLFWYQTWFGRRLTNAQIDRYLADTARPRHIQHALVQIGERMSRCDPGVRRWYPQVIANTTSPVLELRQTAAWIMGQDPSQEPFHDALLRLLRDWHPMVRRNTALSLANFGDPAARSELRAMLRPYTIQAPASGRVKYRLKPGDYVNPGTLIARVGSNEVRSLLPGEVRALGAPEGSDVRSGQPLADVSADKEHAWEALRALLMIGEKEDLKDVEPYARGVPEMPERIQQQAVVTARAIQSRAR